MSENIFAEEWRACLQAHYMHVVRANDRVTEPTLRIVMHDAGFTEAELAELRVRATMHVDDVGADFVPDLDILNPSLSAPLPEGEESVSVEPQAEVFYSLSTPVETDYPLPDDALEPLAEAETLSETFTDEAPPEDDEPDVPRQLTLF
ncbi:MAG: hypothetical protein HZC41_12410 [Chloroflexi bacterium]|nr:hypothetical protein [Chloroflexota bacterium]